MEIVGFHAKQMNGIDYCSAKDSRYEVDGEPMQYALTIISAGGYEDDVGALPFLGLPAPLDLFGLLGRLLVLLHLLVLPIVLLVLQILEEFLASLLSLVSLSFCCSPFCCPCCPSCR